MKKQADQLQAGQTLLEVLLAFSVLILVLGATVLGVTTSLSNAQYAKNQGLANSYAQQGMATIRQIRDSNWANFKSMTGNYCLNKDLILVELLSLNCGQNVGIFSRQITIGDSSACLGQNPTLTPEETSAVSSSGREATVTVSWSDNKCPSGINNPYCHKVELITCFSNIDQKEEP